VNDKHITYLNEAHRLAKKKFGSTFPNPIVGCLIVKNNYIISKAVTAPEGESSHAGAAPAPPEVNTCPSVP